MSAWTILWTGPNPKNPALVDVNARRGSRILRLEALDPATLATLDFDAVWGGASARQAPSPTPANPATAIDNIVALPVPAR